LFTTHTLPFLFIGSTREQLIPDNEPDFDHGGAGMSILQEMLIQTNGTKILLFPAWPKEWDVDFKLHAPQNTIVSGKLAGGELKDLKVIPESRKEDIILHLK